MKKHKKPTYRAPEEVLNGIRKDKLKFDFEYQLYMEKQDYWEETLGRMFKKVSSHCLPNMKQKLCGMPGWKVIDNDQDGISLIKFIHKVYFDTDGPKHSIQDIVTVHKKLFLCFQKKDWSLDK